MILSLCAVGQTTVRRAEAHIAVLATWTPQHIRPTHLLNSARSAEDPQVGVCDPGELLLHRLQKVTSSFQARVGTMITFGREAHRSAVGAAGLGQLVVGARRVPAETHEHGAVGAVVVVVVVHQPLRDGVVHLLIVLLRWCE